MPLLATQQVEPGCTAHITPGGDVRIEIDAAKLAGRAATTELDPVQLAIFSHRWGVAGVLRTTASSGCPFGWCMQVLQKC